MPQGRRPRLGSPDATPAGAAIPRFYGSHNAKTQEATMTAPGQSRAGTRPGLSRKPDRAAIPKTAKATATTAARPRK